MLFFVVLNLRAEHASTWHLQHPVSVARSSYERTKDGNMFIHKLVRPGNSDLDELAVSAAHAMGEIGPIMSFQE